MEGFGDKDYVGATPAWVIWQLLSRYTRKGDAVLDPMCGSGTTIDVAVELGRKPLGFDLAPVRPDIKQADARHLPLAKDSVDFAFINPPYSTHVDYSDDPRCIGKLDAGEKLKTQNAKLETYYGAMGLSDRKFDFCEWLGDDVGVEGFHLPTRRVGVYSLRGFREASPESYRSNVADSTDWRRNLEAAVWRWQEFRDGSRVI